MRHSLRWTICRIQKNPEQTTKGHALLCEHPRLPDLWKVWTGPWVPVKTFWRRRVVGFKRAIYWDTVPGGKYNAHDEQCGYYSMKWQRRAEKPKTRGDQ